MSSYCLTPFYYRVVYSSAALYLRGAKANIVKQIAGHLMHYTGGHPGCMAQMLSLYNSSGFPPDQFVKIYSSQIWQSIVEPEIERILSSSIIEDELWDTLVSLSIYRYLDANILRRLPAKNLLPSMEDPFDLGDKLTKSFLLSWDQNLLSDDIMRRLLDIYLRHQSLVEYVNLSEQAQLVYEEYLREPYVQSPWRWAIEALYQRLKQAVFDIHERNNRRELRKRFFQEDVPPVLSMLVNRQDGTDMVPTLGRVLEKDWEFKFTLNYFLREDVYSDEPSLQLHRLLLAYLAE